LVQKFNFHCAVRCVSQQVFYIVMVSPTNNRGDKLFKSLFRTTKPANLEKKKGLGMTPLY
jgi:hypothetical protein